MKGPGTDSAKGTGGGTIRVAVVEDNAALRRNFKAQCEYFRDIECTGLYPTAEDALRAFSGATGRSAPHVVLMDIELPGMSGIDATIALRELLPDCDIMILTVFEDEEKIFRAIRAGASGYLLKDERFESIIEAVRELVGGGAPMSASIAQKVLGLIRGGELPRGAGPTGPLGLDLSMREREILEGLVRGETYATLAEKLIISPHTVRTHIKNIYRKLHVQSRAAAVRVALQRGLV
jgi:DNA-binding NarL/FixJ family response regulator